MLDQRWFGSKSREVAHVGVLDTTVAREEEPALALALVEIRFHPGTHEIYHVPVGRPVGVERLERTDASRRWTASSSTTPPPTRSSPPSSPR